ncbi:UNVERIFIED_CONTAM: DUF21 domain-containing protein [Campylobacter lari]
MTTEPLQMTSTVSNNVTTTTDYTLPIILLVVLLFLLVLSGIFSSAETAYTSINKAKIESMVERKEFGAKVIKKQHEFFNQTLSTILICNNIVNVASSAIISYVLSVLLMGQNAEKYNVLISTAVMTPIIVIFGEIIPKLVAKKYPEKTAKTFCYILQALYYIF